MPNRSWRFHLLVVPVHQRSPRKDEVFLIYYSISALSFSIGLTDRKPLGKKKKRKSCRGVDGSGASENYSSDGRSVASDLIDADASFYELRHVEP